MTFAYLVVAGLGLVIGSFLNVVIWRVPRGESIVSPPSACPRCGARILARDNVPVLSWLVLRGACRGCKEPISVRYPLVELGTAVVFCGVLLRFGASSPWALPAYLYLGAVAMALALIDLDVHRLPDQIVKPSYPVLAVLLVVATWGADQGWSSAIRALIGGAALLLLYLGLVVIYPRGMGWGDVKLAGLLGAACAWAGWGAFAVGAFGAFFLGGLFSIGLLLARRARRGTGIPFGPWMLLGAAIGIAWGNQLWSAYLSLMV